MRVFQHTVCRLTSGHVLLNVLATLLINETDSDHLLCAGGGQLHHIQHAAVGQPCKPESCRDIKRPLEVPRE